MDDTRTHRNLPRQIAAKRIAARVQLTSFPHCKPCLCVFKPASSALAEMNCPFPLRISAFPSSSLLKFSSGFIKERLAFVESIWSTKRAAIPIVCKPASPCSSAAMNFRGKALEDKQIACTEKRPAPEVRVVYEGRSPVPRFNWKLRALVPGLLLGGLLFFWDWAAYEELLPTSITRAASRSY